MDINLQLPFMQTQLMSSYLASQFDSSLRWDII